MKKALIRHLRYVLAAPLLFVGSAWAQGEPLVDVYKNRNCSCCGKWVQHLQQGGFAVRTHDVADTAVTRRQLQVPDLLASCHTARVGPYVIEGHVPAADIVRLLKEKPKALGLAVPGMPAGSPGMETTASMPYDTLLINPVGRTVVFARH